MGLDSIASRQMTINTGKNQQDPNTSLNAREQEETEQQRVQRVEKEHAFERIVLNVKDIIMDNAIYKGCQMSGRYLVRELLWDFFNDF